MLPLDTIEKEHKIIKIKLDEIEKAFSHEDNKRILQILSNFESYWNMHEEREEKLIDWFEKKSGKKFPYGKTIINEHRQLRGHWKVLKEFLKHKKGPELQAALDTDGRMILNKIRKHIRDEDEFFDKNFRKQQLSGLKSGS